MSTPAIATAATRIRELMVVNLFGGVQQREAESPWKAITGSHTEDVI
jgi:hypothetical protein